MSAPSSATICNGGWRPSHDQLCRAIFPPGPRSCALFPEDIALVLGRMVVQLADLIGGWRLDQGGAETPNGYDGVVLRGDYERLLTSEWLLLDELPEEFLRRAVSREHMFLRRACQGSAAARRCMALFDCGAEQLGAPRIAQIAILIVLGQRAEKLGASFEWGVLQAPVATLRNSVGAAQVHDLLRSRYARPVSPEDVEPLDGRLEPRPGFRTLACRSGRALGPWRAGAACRRCSCRTFWNWARRSGCASSRRLQAERGRRRPSWPSPKAARRPDCFAIR